MRHLLLVALVAATCGCSELQARRHARAGNAHFQAGDYAAAVREYERAEQIHPDLYEVSLNRGIACRRLMVPGVRSAEQDCALAAFERLGQLRPEDPRGEQLYVQTLFDADRFDTLVARYEAELNAKPGDLATINGLISVHSRSGNWNEGLRWSMKRADLDPQDAQAQTAVGSMIFHRLYHRGGSGKDDYDPRPNPALSPRQQLEKSPPAFSVGDVVGAARIELAELGIRYTQRAIQLRPKDPHAISYLRLLYLQKAYAFFAEPHEWVRCRAAAEEWLMQLEGAPAGPDPAAHPVRPGPGSPT